MMTTKTKNNYCKDDIIIRVPTKTASNYSTKQQPPQIDISKLNEDDLKLLKTQDPFLYHSIPSVNKAKLIIKPIDHTRVIQDATATLASSAVISRRTRVTTECHATLILDDLVMDEVFSTDDDHRHSHAATSEPATDLEDMMHLLIDLDDDFIISDHTCLEQ